MKSAQSLKSIAAVADGRDHNAEIDVRGVGHYWAKSLTHGSRTGPFRSLRNGAVGLDLLAAHKFSVIMETKLS